MAAWRIASDVRLAGASRQGVSSFEELGPVPRAGSGLRGATRRRWHERTVSPRGHRYPTSEAQALWPSEPAYPGIWIGDRARLHQCPVALLQPLFELCWPPARVGRSDDAIHFRWSLVGRRLRTSLNASRGSVSHAWHHRTNSTRSMRRWRPSVFQTNERWRPSRSAIWACVRPARRLAAIRRSSTSRYPGAESELERRCRLAPIQELTVRSRAGCTKIGALSRGTWPSIPVGQNGVRLR